MSDTYGTTIDFLSLSFRGDDFGRVQEKCPEELAGLLLSLLREYAPFSYLPRNGFYRFSPKYLQSYKLYISIRGRAKTIVDFYLNNLK